MTISKNKAIIPSIVFAMLIILLPSINVFASDTAIVIPMIDKLSVFFGKTLNGTGGNILCGAAIVGGISGYIFTKNMTFIVGAIVVSILFKVFVMMIF